MQTALTVIALGLWVAAVLFSLWWLYGGHSAAEPKGDPETPVVVPPEPSMAVVASVEALRKEIHAAERRRPKVVAPEPWRVEFRSGSGRRILGRERRTDRRPTQITYVGMDGLKGSFVQDHQLPDGTWVYRRVSVER